ncbi:hypothetical protein VTN00DRAFT_6560 [Thermoascus crustaceus]|uniref:uncharacterized protein n=1 Tax=Thermoascus crustaceus TaxID=5088 RepID=UPI0037425A82
MISDQRTGSVVQEEEIEAGFLGLSCIALKDGILNKSNRADRETERPSETRANQRQAPSGSYQPYAPEL